MRRYAEEAFVEREFVPGETHVPVAGRVIGAPELEALADASLDGWLTEGRFAARVLGGVRGGGRALAGAPGGLGLAGEPAGRRGAPRRTCTSGPLQPGDEVITPALGFSTTVGPLYQYGLVPVYVDVELDTFNPSLEAIAAAIGDRTRADPASPTAWATRSTPPAWPSCAASTTSC